MLAVIDLPVIHPVCEGHIECVNKSFIGVGFEHHLSCFRMKSPVLGDHHHHHCATWHDAVDRKVMIAQTLVRGT